MFEIVLIKIYAYIVATKKYLNYFNKNLDMLKKIIEALKRYVNGEDRDPYQELYEIGMGTVRETLKQYTKLDEFYTRK